MQTAKDFARSIFDCCHDNDDLQYAAELVEARDRAVALAALDALEADRACYQPSQEWVWRLALERVRAKWSGEASK